MTSNKYFHLTLAERQIIETGISHGSTKAAIAETLGIKVPSEKKSNYTALNPPLPVIHLTVLYSQSAKTKTLSSAIFSALPISPSLVSAEIALRVPVTAVRSILVAIMINTNILLRRQTANIATPLLTLDLVSMQRFLRLRSLGF